LKANRGREVWQKSSCLPCFSLDQANVVND
jgi:hypothetical protein